MHRKIKELYEKLEPWELDVIKWLRKTRPTLYTILRHVSNSGMSRDISVIAIRDNEIYHLDYLVSKLTGYKLSKNEGVKIGGCGMDMGFALVYSFSSRVFPTGFRYRKNEWHRNNDPSPIDRSGGYALKQRWL